MRIRSCLFFCLALLLASHGSELEPSHGLGPPPLAPSPHPCLQPRGPLPDFNPPPPHTHSALLGPTRAAAWPDQPSPPPCWPFSPQTWPLGEALPVTLSFMTLFTSFPLSGFSAVLFIVYLLPWNDPGPGPRLCLGHGCRARGGCADGRLGEGVPAGGLGGATCCDLLSPALQAHL